MQNAICEVHLDPNPKFHHQPLSAKHQEPGDARAMGSPETRLTYLDGRAPMFDTVPQPMTVDALTTKMLDCQSFQTAHSQAKSNQSEGYSFGRLTERWRIPS